MCRTHVNQSCAKILEGFPRESPVVFVDRLAVMFIKHSAKLFPWQLQVVSLSKLGISATNEAQSKTHPSPFLERFMLLRSLRFLVSFSVSGEGVGT